MTDCHSGRIRAVRRRSEHVAQLDVLVERRRRDGTELCESVVELLQQQTARCCHSNASQPRYIVLRSTGLVN